MLAQVPGQRAGVELADPWDAGGAQVVVEGLVGAPVGVVVAALADQQGGEPGAARLGVGGGYAIVADQRVGQHDQLAAVGGVGADLLVAGHAGGEDHLAAAAGVQRLDRAERHTGERRPILQHQHGLHFDRLVTYHSRYPCSTHPSDAARSAETTRFDAL